MLRSECRQFPSLSSTVHVYVKYSHKEKKQQDNILFSLQTIACLCNKSKLFYFYDQNLSVVRRSRHFSHFHLPLQNHWAILGERNSKGPPLCYFPRGYDRECSKNELRMFILFGEGICSNEGLLHFQGEIKAKIHRQLLKFFKASFGLFK